MVEVIQDPPIKKKESTLGRALVMTANSPCSCMKLNSH